MPHHHHQQQQRQEEEEQEFHDDPYYDDNDDDEDDDIGLSPYHHDDEDHFHHPPDEDHHDESRTIPPFQENMATPPFHEENDNHHHMGHPVHVVVDNNDNEGAYEHSLQEFHQYQQQQQYQQEQQQEYYSDHPDDDSYDNEMMDTDEEPMDDEDVVQQKTANPQEILDNDNEQEDQQQKEEHLKDVPAHSHSHPHPHPPPSYRVEQDHPLVHSTSTSSTVSSLPDATMDDRNVNNDNNHTNTNKNLSLLELIVQRKFENAMERIRHFPMEAQWSWQQQQQREQPQRQEYQTTDNDSDDNDDDDNTTTNNLNLPLHEACQHGAPLSLIELLMEVYPSATSRTGQWGYLPLHCACLAARTFDRTHVIAKLLALYPIASKHTHNVHGRLPLHLAAKYKADPSIFMMLVLVHPKGYLTQDKNGMCPLDYVAVAPKPSQPSHQHRQPPQQPQHHHHHYSSAVVVQRLLQECAPILLSVSKAAMTQLGHEQDEKIRTLSSQYESKFQTIRTQYQEDKTLAVRLERELRHELNQAQQAQTHAERQVQELLQEQREQEQNSQMNHHHDAKQQEQQYKQRKRIEEFERALMAKEEELQVALQSSRRLDEDHAKQQQLQQQQQARIEELELALHAKEMELQDTQRVMERIQGLMTTTTTGGGGGRSSSGRKGTTTKNRNMEDTAKIEGGYSAYTQHSLQNRPVERAHEPTHPRSSPGPILLGHSRCPKIANGPVTAGGGNSPRATTTSMAREGPPNSSSIYRRSYGSVQQQQHQQPYVADHPVASTTSFSTSTKKSTKSRHTVSTSSMTHTNSHQHLRSMNRNVSPVKSPRNYPVGRNDDDDMPGARSPYEMAVTSNERQKSFPSKSIDGGHQKHPSPPQQSTTKSNKHPPRTAAVMQSNSPGRQNVSPSKVRQESNKHRRQSSRAASPRSNAVASVKEWFSPESVLQDTTDQAVRPDEDDLLSRLLASDRGDATGDLEYLDEELVDDDYDKGDAQEAEMRQDHGDYRDVLQEQRHEPTKDDREDYEGKHQHGGMPQRQPQETANRRYEYFAEEERNLQRRLETKNNGRQRAKTPPPANIRVDSHMHDPPAESKIHSKWSERPIPSPSKQSLLSRSKSAPRLRLAPAFNHGDPYEKGSSSSSNINQVNSSAKSQSHGKSYERREFQRPRQRKETKQGPVKQKRNPRSRVQEGSSPYTSTETHRIRRAGGYLRRPKSPGVFEVRQGQNYQYTGGQKSTFSGTTIPSKQSHRGMTHSRLTDHSPPPQKYDPPPPHENDDDYVYHDEDSTLHSTREEVAYE